MHAMELPAAGRDTSHVLRRFRVWETAFALLAIAIAVPIASDAYDKLVQVNYKARERLVLEHRLWELQPGFRGKPETWARFASRLLTDRQLLSRVTAKYGAAADQIELEYRRDLTIARAEVIVVALALWAAPLALLYAIAWALRRRKAAPLPKTPPPSASDPRYLPPGS